MASGAYPNGPRGQRLRGATRADPGGEGRPTPAELDAIGDEIAVLSRVATAAQVETIVRAWRRVDRNEEREQESARHARRRWCFTRLAHHVY